MARISRQESKDLTRQRLREAARVEFSSYGVAASSIDRITEAAGYSRGAFYSNYSSKNELALELINENNSRDVALWQNMIDTLHDPAVLVPELRAHFDQVTRQRDWSLLRLELRLEAERDPQFRASYDAANEALISQLQAMIRALARVAACEDSTDVEHVARVVYAFAHGLQLEQRAHSARPLAAGDLLLRLLFDLLGRPARLAPLFPPVTTHKGDRS